MQARSETKRAWASNAGLRPDIAAEQEKLLWADAGRQNGGHYDTRQVLKPGLGRCASGTRIHVVEPGEPEQLPVEVEMVRR